MNKETKEIKRYLKLIAAHRYAKCVEKDEHMQTIEHISYKMMKLLGLTETFTRIDAADSEAQIQLEAHKLMDAESVKEFFKAPSTFIDRWFS